jgi:hypothetical protein
VGDVLLEAHGIKTAKRKAFPGLTTEAQIAELWVSLVFVKKVGVLGFSVRYAPAVGLALL